MDFMHIIAGPLIGDLLNLPQNILAHGVREIFAVSSAWTPIGAFAETALTVSSVAASYSASCIKLQFSFICVSI